MRVAILLADKGTPSGQGALNLLNAGWTATQLQPPIIPGPGAPPMSLTPPHAVAIFIDVEPRYCNRPIELRLELVTQDEQPVELPGPAGPQPMIIRQMLTVQSPAGRPPGSNGSAASLVEIFPGLPLASGVYIWKVTLDNEHDDDWIARFHVLPTPGVQPASFGALPPTS